MSTRTHAAGGHRGHREGMGTHSQHIRQTATAIVLVTAVPVATWGLVGQQDASGVPRAELDHAFQPLAVPAGLDTVLGVIALSLTAAAAAVLARAHRQRRLDRRWWEVLVPLVVAGLLAGAGWRVMTAGVVGGNIGAGIVFVLGGPLLIALLLWSLVRALWLARAGRRADGGGNSTHRRLTV
jgi:hypothetical protein